MTTLSKFFLNLLILFCISLTLNGEEPTKLEKKENEDVSDKTTTKEPPKIGNFSLPLSQQPAALFGFGGNVISEGEVILNLFVDEFRGRNRAIIDVIPGILFGVNENFSVYFNFPVTPEFKDRKNKSAGFEDFFLQLEYAVYNKTTYTYSDQATVVGNITTPTGSIKKIPPTGFGSPSFFLGGTYYRTTVEWVFYTSQGAIMTTTNRGTKIGDQFLYQCGIARNFSSPPGWIYAGLFEVDGQYSRKNRFHGKKDPNSGGNAIYVTPSLWISSKEMISQFGISFPVNQNWFGRQGKFDYALNFNFSWSFYKD